MTIEQTIVNAITQEYGTGSETERALWRIVARNWYAFTNDDWQHILNIVFSFAKPKPNADKQLARDWRVLCRNIGGYDHYQHDPNRHLDVTDHERRLLARFVD